MPAATRPTRSAVRADVAAPSATSRRAADADQRHRDDSAQRHGESLPEHVVAVAEAPGREVERREHPVLGARLSGQGVLEPRSFRVQPRLDRVVQRVVEQQLLVALDHPQVAEPPGRAERGDGGEAPPELSRRHCVPRPRRPSGRSLAGARSLASVGQPSHRRQSRKPVGQVLTPFGACWFMKPNR